MEKIQTAARIALKNKLKQMTAEDIQTGLEEKVENAINEPELIEKKEENNKNNEDEG